MSLYFNILIEQQCLTKSSNDMVYSHCYICISAAILASHHFGDILCFFISGVNLGADKQGIVGSTWHINSPFNALENSYEPRLYYGNLVHGEDDYRLQLPVINSSIAVSISHQRGSLNDIMWTYWQYVKIIPHNLPEWCKIVSWEMSDRCDWPPRIILNTKTSASAHHCISQIPCVSCRHACGFYSRNNLNVYRLVLLLSLRNPLKPGVKSRMKM